jgi:adenylate kinase
VLIAITGVPGTGKSTLAGELSKRTGWPLVEANVVVDEQGLWKGEEGGARVADLRALSGTLRRRISGEENLILVGHLLCEVRLPANRVVVLRTNPRVLRERLRYRGYPNGKIDENVMAEALDYCTIRSEENYREVYELDTGIGLGESLSQLLAISSGRGEEFRAGRISWGKELEEEISRGNEKLAFGPNPAKD